MEQPEHLFFQLAIDWHQKFEDLFSGRNPWNWQKRQGVRLLFHRFSEIGRYFRLGWLRCQTTRNFKCINTHWSVFLHVLFFMQDKLNNKGKVLLKTTVNSKFHSLSKWATTHWALIIKLICNAYDTPQGHRIQLHSKNY